MTIGHPFGILGPPPSKPRIFVSYHHGGDRQYYERLVAIFDSTYDVLHDHSVEREIDSDDSDYVIRRIRENFITGSSCTIVLVGSYTWQRRFVDWEIKATLDKGHGLIGVHLPNAPISSDNKIIVPYRLHDNVCSGYAVWLSWQDLIFYPSNLPQYIANANSRSKSLIANDRPKKHRNG